MEQKKNTKKSIGGSILLGSIVGLGGLQANASELFNFNDLGSGSEVRSQLLQTERTIDNAIELSCGEKSEKKNEGKATESKCGEEGKKAKSTEAAAEGKALEGKAAEHKCGEEGKATEKASKKESKKEGKATEHKCGEGKCGGRE